MVGDMIAITDKSPDVLTKHAKALGDISYKLNDDEDDDEEEDDEDDDARLAKKVAQEEDDEPSEGRRSTRLALNKESGVDVEGLCQICEATFHGVDLYDPVAVLGN